MEEKTVVGVAELAELLKSVPKFGDGPGLHRMADLVGRLKVDDFLADLDAVKVTGSNGKGAVATLLADLWRQLGIRSGLFTSPHLRSPTERILVDGRELGGEEWRASWRRVDGLAQELGLRGEAGNRIGAFEILTAVMLERAAAHGVETLVAEAGIGGRLDPTRAIPGRIVGLTSLDLEHTSLLGESLELIAYDKTDLCPDGGVVIVGSAVEQGIESPLLQRLRGYLAVRGASMREVDDAARLTDVRYQDSRMILSMEFRGQQLDGIEMAMRGRFQWSNAVLALLLAEAWLERHRPRVGKAELIEAWRQTVATTALPGRFEVVADEPTTVVDFCHTPRAAQAVADLAAVVFAGQPIVLVLGVSDDKDAVAISEPLLAIAEVAILTRAHQRGTSTVRLLASARSLYPGLEIEVIESPASAVAMAREVARRQGAVLLVVGGLFLGVEAKEALAGRDPTALRFF